MKANIAKILSDIERLERQIANLERTLTENRSEMELLYARLANISQYSKSYTEQELAVNPQFPFLLARMIQAIY